MVVPRAPAAGRGIPTAGKGTPDRFAALLDALARADVASGFAGFAALCAARPPDPRFATWLRTAMLAAAPAGESGEEGAPALAADVAAARADPAASHRLFIRAAWGAGHPDCALAAGREALRQAPDEAATLFLLCALLLKRGDGAAQDVLQTALTRFPQPSRGWTEIGAILLAAGQREGALVCFGRGLPSVALAMRRGLLARELGHLKTAQAAFTEAARLDPHSTRALFLLGLSAQDRRDPGTAAAAYRAALALDDRLAEAAVNLGTVLQETGDLEGARAAYARGLALRPDTFGRIAQALTTSPKGELWLDLAALRRSLGA